MRACALLLIVLSLARGTFAAEAPIPPAPANFMTDEAGLLSAALEHCRIGSDYRMRLTAAWRERLLC